METVWLDLVIFFGFALSLLLSAAAVMSQDGEATDGLRFPTAVVQWLSTLCCSEDIALWFQVILFDMLLVCWQGEVLLVSVLYTSVFVCTPSYAVQPAYKSIFNPHLWQCPTLTNNQLFSFFSPPLFHTAPLGKSHSADGWVTVENVRESKVPEVHSFPRHRWKLLALRPALIFRPW